MKEELPVDKPIFLDVSRLAEEDIGFGLLVGEGGGSDAVGKTAFIR
jgi:hypothetical protein